MGPASPSKAVPSDWSRSSGHRDVEIDFPVAPARQTLFLKQNGDDLRGSHRGDRTGGDAQGWIEGEVDMGEYFTAKFTARRHA